MDLRVLETGNKSIKNTTYLAIAFCMILSVVYIISHVIMSREIGKIIETMIVIDTKGQLYPSETITKADGRIFEYENHVMLFYQYWYSFDEYNFQQHIEAGLELIGEKGKELLNEYIDIGVKRSLSEKNLKYEVQITDIKVDMSTVPVSGYIEGIQTGRRAKGFGSRKLSAKFTLYDVGRSRSNRHGCKIDQWEIYESEIISEPEK